MEGFLKTGLFGSLLSPKASPHGSPVRGIEAEPSLQIQWRRLISSSDPFVDKHHHPLFHLGFNKSLFFEWARPLDDTYVGFGFLLRLIELRSFGLHLPKDVAKKIPLRLGPELIYFQTFVNVVKRHLGFNIRNHNKLFFFNWIRLLEDIFIAHLCKQVQPLLTISKDEAADSGVSLPLDNLAALQVAGAGRLYIPEEVVEEILLRLTPESLVVCKCVCKLWYELINRQSFVDKHLRFNIQKQRSNNSSSVSLFLKWTCQDPSLRGQIFIGRHFRGHHVDDLSKHALSLVTISKDDDAAASDSDDLPNCNFEQVGLPPVIVGTISCPEPVHQQIKNLAAIHCHGIICLFDAARKSSIVLCNPALRTFKIFYPPSVFDFVSLGLGFGYDPRANVYKIVCIYGYTYNCVGPCRAKVYTLGTDSWREIVAPKRYCILCPRGVYCRGVFYWWNIMNSYSGIVSFDMSAEEFHFIPVPDDTVGGRSKLNELAVWNESIAIFSSTEFSLSSARLEMWVMVDNPDNGVYWRKHLTTGPLARIYKPLQFWKDDELLIDTRDGRIVSYNLHTQKLRKLPIPTGEVSPGLTYASLCFKSLVSF